MAKKVTQIFKANLAKNTIVEKGGAWLLTISIATEAGDIESFMTAWANPSAAKRYLKTVVLEKTPRKSIKMIVTEANAENKPLALDGDLTYKVEA